MFFNSGCNNFRHKNHIVFTMVFIYRRNSLSQHHRDFTKNVEISKCRLKCWLTNVVLYTKLNIQCIGTQFTNKLTYPECRDNECRLYLHQWTHLKWEFCTKFSTTVKFQTLNINILYHGVVNFFLSVIPRRCNKNS